VCVPVPLDGDARRDNERFGHAFGYTPAGNIILRGRNGRTRAYDKAYVDTGRNYDYAGPAVLRCSSL